MFRLYDFLMPKKEICTEQQLYFRIAEPKLVTMATEAIGNEQIVFLKNGSVSFDTYFNAFTYTKFLKYTSVRKLGISLKMKGNFLIKLKSYRRNAHGEYECVILTELAFQSDVPENKNIIYDFSADDSEGYCYIELTSDSDQSVFYNGFYFSELKESDINPVNLAVTICTYKREEYVYQNVDILNQYFFENPNLNFKDSLRFFIIDNGHSLDSGKIRSQYIRVMENKNFGGSGGFTRGMIEAYRQRALFSHVLMMDDDIVFEPDVLKRTITFLSVLREEYRDLCIGGGMLRLDKRFLQHESGGHWDGMRVRMQKTNLDLTDKRNLLTNELGHGANYNGWWYFCMPLHLIDQHNLPFPFFIKDDDTEYGLRLNLSKNLLLLNGIGIWHEPFDAKYREHLEYYVKRNEAVLSAIHYPEYGPISHAYKMWRSVLKNLSKHNFFASLCSLLAYEDFLKGPDFFLNMNEEKLNTQLINQSKEKRNIKTFVQIVSKLISVSFGILTNFKMTAEAYRKRKGEITSIEFWCDHLDI